MGNKSFNRASDIAGKSYDKLCVAFRDIKNWSDAYEVARVKKWQAKDPLARESALQEMSQVRQAIVSRLNDPQHAIPVLLNQTNAHADALTGAQQGNLFLMQKTYDEMRPFMPDAQHSSADKLMQHEKNLDTAFRQWAMTLGLAETDPALAWQKQKQPLLDAAMTIGESMRTVAQARNLSLYDACLQKLCPGMSEQSVSAMFASLKKEYAPMVQKIRAEDQRTQDDKPLPLPSIPKEAQAEIFAALRDDVLAAAGWDAQSMADQNIVLKLSTAQTGYSWGSPKNITVAIETYEENFMASYLNCFHELGHTVYLMHLNRLPEDQQKQMTANFNGFGAHEFSAMNFEMMASRRDFLAQATPRIHDILQRHGVDTDNPALSVDNLYKTANRPDLERNYWGASELVLAPNMAFRAQTERDILTAIEARDRETLKTIIDEMPQRWSDTMAGYLGEEARPDPNLFSLGESHWFEDLLGYFPAYMQGAIAAAQMQTTVIKTLPPAGGDLTTLIRQYIQPMEAFYLQGASKNPVTLLAETVGGPMDTGHYLARLSSAALPGMPGPDAVLAQKNTGGVKPPASFTL